MYKKRNFFRQTHMEFYDCHVTSRAMDRQLTYQFFAENEGTAT